MIPKNHWNLSKHCPAFNHTRAAETLQLFYTLLQTGRGFSSPEFTACVVGGTKWAPHSSPVLWDPDPPHPLTSTTQCPDKMLEMQSAAGEQGGLTDPGGSGKAIWSVSVLHPGAPLCLCPAGTTPASPLWQNPHPKQKEAIRPRKLLLELSFGRRRDKCQEHFLEKTKTSNCAEDKEGEECSVWAVEALVRSCPASPALSAVCEPALLNQHTKQTVQS